MQIRLLAITPPGGPIDPMIVDAWAPARAYGLAVLLRRPGLDVASTLSDPQLVALRSRAQAEGIAIVVSCDPKDRDGPSRAVAAGLSGVQLRGDPDPTGVASARRAGVAIVGASMHAPAPARLPGADYLCVGPVFAPRTQPADRTKAGVGTAALAAFCGRGVPVIALGGVTGATAGACIAAGAHGLASIRSFFGPTAEVVDHVLAFCAALDRGVAGS